MSAKKVSKIIRRGPASSKGNTDFISIKEDEPVTIVPVLATEHIISIDLHAFWQINPAVTFACLAGSGEKCPGCESGDKPGYRAFLPVLNGDGELKVFAFGISVERQLVNLEDELDTIVGLKLRVRRTGSGLKTKYLVMNTGKSTEVDVDENEVSEFVESKIEIKDRKKILEEMAGAGLINDEDADEDVAEVEDEEADEPVKAKKIESKPRAAGKVSAATEKMLESKKKAKASRTKDADEDEDEWDE